MLFKGIINKLVRFKSIFETYWSSFAAKHTRYNKPYYHIEIKRCWIVALKSLVLPFINVCLVQDAKVVNAISDFYGFFLDKQQSPKIIERYCDSSTNTCTYTIPKFTGKGFASSFIAVKYHNGKQQMTLTSPAFVEQGGGCMR